jgi:hypothetical protein
MAAHSKLGASSAYRWFECPGSVRLLEALPSRPSSAPAEEGTAAHELAEKCLLSGEPAAAYVGRTVYNHLVDEDMARAVQMYLDEVARILAENPNAEVMVEQKFHLDWIDDRMFGTNDCSVIAHFDTLYVLDYKHGRGIPVEAVGNKQMMYYALGAAREADVENICMIIVQPRCAHKDGPIRRWTITMDDLIEWQDTELLPAVEAVDKPSPTFKAGDHCFFCEGKGECPAIRDKAVALIGETFEDMSDSSVSLPDPEVLSSEEIAKILDSTKMLDGWLKAVDKVAEERLRSGNEVPGYKLVRGRSLRKYRNEAEAKKAAIDEFGADKCLTEPELLSIAQLEKKVGKKAVASFEKQQVIKPEGKIVLARESDSRPAICMNEIVEQVFIALD